jgi:hypothetical protein
MSDEPVQIPIKISADQASISAAQARIAELEKEINALAKETNGFTDATTLQKKALNNAVSELKAYRKATADLGKESKESANDVEALNQSLRKAATTLTDIKEKRLNEALRMQQSRFQQAGDIESGLRAASGAAGALGVGGASQTIGLVAELPGLYEGFGKLKAGITGLPSIISSVATGLGPVGIGLGAVAIAAGAAFAIASKELEKLDKQAQEAADALLEQARANAEIEQLLLRGDNEGVMQRLIQLQDQYQKDLLTQGNIFENLQVAEAAERAQDESQGAIEGFFDGLGGATNTLAERTANRIEDDFKEAERTAVDSAGKFIDALAAAGVSEEELAAYRLENSEATQAAKRAEEELAAARAKTTLEAAAAAGRELAARQRADNANAESNRARLKAIEDERAQIEAQLTVLRESNDTSEQVTGQIAMLNQRLSELGGEAEYISRTALNASKDRERKEKAEEAADEKRQQRIEAAKKAEEEHAEAQQAALDILQEYNQKIIDLAKKRAEEETKALQRLEDARDKANLSLQRGEEDAGIKAQRDALEAEIDIQRRRRDAAIKLADDLQDIQDNAAKEEKELARERSFSAIFALRERTRDELQNRSKDYLREQRDQNTAQDDQRQDMLRAQDQEREDRLRNYDRALQDAQTQYEKERALAKSNEEKALAELQNWKAQETALLTATYGAQYALVAQFGTAAVSTLQQAVNAAQQLAPYAVKMGAGNKASGTKSGQMGVGDKTYSKGGNSSSTTINSRGNTNIDAPITISGSGNPQIAAKNIAKELARLMR